MCVCDPNIRTPWCGKLGCKAPQKQLPDNLQERFETAFAMGRARKQEMVDNLVWAEVEIATCNCKSCQYIRAYYEDLMEILT